MKVINTKTLESLLRSKLTSISSLNIQDTSGGCGQAFTLEISSNDFKGQSVIQQHRLINTILKEELKSIHSLQIKTSIPPDV
jgi:BolA-like protein 3